MEKKNPRKKNKTERLGKLEFGNKKRLRFSLFFCFFRNLNLTDRQAVESARQLTTDLRNKKQEKTRYWHVTLGMWSQCILGKFTFRYPKRGRKKKAVDMGPTSAASVLLRALHADKNNVFFCRDYLVVGIRRETLNETDTTGISSDPIRHFTLPPWFGTDLFGVIFSRRTWIVVLSCEFSLLRLRGGSFLYTNAFSSISGWFFRVRHPTWQGEPDE